LPSETSHRSQTLAASQAAGREVRWRVRLAVAANEHEACAAHRRRVAKLLRHVEVNRHFSCHSRCWEPGISEVVVLLGLATEP
jgi:hypothetical protein